MKVCKVKAPVHRWQRKHPSHVVSERWVRRPRQSPSCDNALLSHLLSLMDETHFQEEPSRKGGPKKSYVTEAQDTPSVAHAWLQFAY